MYPVRRSRSLQRSRRVSLQNQNILNFTSDYEEYSQRNSNWWKDLSLRKSIVHQFKTSENNLLGSNSSCENEELHSKWMKDLSLADSIQFLKEKNFTEEQDNDNLSKSTSSSEENKIVKKTLFTTKEKQSRKYRFSQAFNVESQEANTNIEVDETRDIEVENLKSPPEIEKETCNTKKGRKRKIKKLFSIKPNKRKFSDAFVTPEIEMGEVQEINDACNESGTLEQELNKEDKKIDTIKENKNIQSMEDVEKISSKNDSSIFGSENINKSKSPEPSISSITTEIETNIQQKNLFAKISRKTRDFSNAFEKSKSPESSKEEIGDKTSFQKSNSPKLSKDANADQNVSDVTSEIDGNVQQTKKTRRTRNVSEAFDKSKSSKLSKQEIEDTILDVTAENDGNVEQNNSVHKKIRRNRINSDSSEEPKSPELEDKNKSKKSDVTIEIDGNIQQNKLFAKKNRRTRNFSEAFDESKSSQSSNQEIGDTNLTKNNKIRIESDGIVEQNNLVHKKMRRNRMNSDSSKKSNSPELKDKNESKKSDVTIEIDEDIQQNKLFAKKNRKTIDFSEAFDESKSSQSSNQEVGDANLTKNSKITTESDGTVEQSNLVHKKMRRNRMNSNSSETSKSPELEDKNESKKFDVAIEIDEDIQQNKLFAKKTRKTINFSEAFDESKSSQSSNQEIGDTNLTKNSKIITESDGIVEQNNSGHKKIRRNRTNSESSEKSKSHKLENKNDVTIEIDENIQQNKLFAKKIRRTRNFSEAFENLNNQETTKEDIEDTNLLKNSDYTTEIDDDIEGKKIFSKLTRRTRNFSEAFEKSKNMEALEEDIGDTRNSQLNIIASMKVNDNTENEIIAKSGDIKNNLENNKKVSKTFLNTQNLQTTSQNTEISKDTANISEPIEINPIVEEINNLDTSTNVQSKNKLISKIPRKISNDNKLKSTNHFKENDSENKKPENINVPDHILEQTDTKNSLILSTIPSINDTTEEPKHLFRANKVRKSLFSDENKEKSLMKNPRISKLVENMPMHLRRSMVFSDKDSIDSKLFENSLISSTKININNRSDTEENQDVLSDNKEKEKTPVVKKSKKDITTSNKSSKTSVDDNKSKVHSSTEFHKETLPINTNISIRKSIKPNKTDSKKLHSSSSNKTSKISLITNETDPVMFLSNLNLKPSPKRNKPASKIISQPLIMKKNEEKLQHRKDLLLKISTKDVTQVSNTAALQLQTKKITDYFTQIGKKDYENIVQQDFNKQKKKNAPKPLSTAIIIDGKRYNSKKLFRGERWCNPRFYKFLQKKMENKFGLDTINKSENLMKSIADSVNVITKSKKYMPSEIDKLKKELAQHQVITTLHDFYILVADYLPFSFRDKVIPCTKADYVKTQVPFREENLFEKIEF